MARDLKELTGHLFDQLNRLQNPDLSGDDIKLEISRAAATTAIAREIIATGRLAVDAQRVAHDIGGPAYRAPKLLGLDGDERT